MLCVKGFLMSESQCRYVSSQCFIDGTYQESCYQRTQKSVHDIAYAWIALKGGVFEGRAELRCTSLRLPR